MDNSTGELTRQERREIAIGDLRADIESAAPVYRKLLEASESEILRFMTEAVHVIVSSKNDKLLQADRQSLLVALGEAAAARLSINPTLGEAYLIPRKGGVDFQPGYKGLTNLAWRSGMIDSIYVDVVYAGEQYGRTGGTSPGIDHVPDDSLRTNNIKDIVGAYASVWIKGSSRPISHAITKATIVAAAEASGDPRNNNYSDVWVAHPEAMAFKTALIRVAKLLPRSDKFRDFHLVAERESLREVNVAPPPIHELEQVGHRHAVAAAPEPARQLEHAAPTEPVDPLGPRCTGKAAGIARAIAERVQALASILGIEEARVYHGAIKSLKIDLSKYPTPPRPVDLTTIDGKALSCFLKNSLDKHTTDPEAEREREPGDDDDVEPEQDPPDISEADDYIDPTAAGAL